MNTAFTGSVVPEGPGAVTGAPDLPAGFADTYTSRIIDTGDVRLHAVIGGRGPALLLIHGWPETWYAWRLLMPELAKDFTVIAVDQRGAGLSDKPESGYDTGTVARDLIGLMDALGHERFAVVGHDTGFAVGYALAADHADRVTRVALAEIPAPPGATPAPPLFLPRPLNEKLWHIPFNRAAGLPEQLIAGREDVYFGYEFAIQGGGVTQETIDYYIGLVSDPVSLTGSLGFYRAFDETLAQNAERAQRKLTVPVLAIGGERSYGPHVEENMHGLAEDVTGLVVEGAGHWVAEEAPEQMLDALREFLVPEFAASAVR
ncbi:alpha/beta fold hydrolase [Agromyces aurantiacus]|uniref:Alpha/beta fold hydrolase n=1 Tax=Agromyces aurantiacus TaxID=165814 RepID=A0ABV9R8E3_9MICO|nr:alpha/beta hydrolase [Agromyces aurantiacus]MBM7505105.1 pimeloyl-ACP methyl ester carboxylesterase [Agromyces aurantiacus]